MLRRNIDSLRHAVTDVGLRTCIAVGIIICATNVSAEELWRGAAYGMSVQEVLKANKDARPVHDGSHLHGGANELARIDHIEIANESFGVFYYFKNDKLEQVTLSLNKKRPFGQILIVYGEIANILRSKYGKEMNNRVENISVLRTANANWTNGKVNIRLAAIGVEGNPASLNIVYQVRFSAEAEKL